MNWEEIKKSFLEKNFKYVFLGKQQTANSSQINRLNMPNACLFCSASFLGFKITNEFWNQNPNILVVILNFNLEEKRHLKKFFLKSGLFKIASITVFLIDQSLKKRLLLLTHT